MSEFVPPIVEVERERYDAAMQEFAACLREVGYRVEIGPDASGILTMVGASYAAPAPDAEIERQYDFCYAPVAAVDRSYQATSEPQVDAFYQAVGECVTDPDLARLARATTTLEQMTAFPEIHACALEVRQDLGLPPPPDS